MSCVASYKKLHCPVGQHIYVIVSCQYSLVEMRYCVSDWVIYTSYQNNYYTWVASILKYTAEVVCRSFDSIINTDNLLENPRT